MPVTVSMKVNGRPVSAVVEPRTLLVEYIREHLGLAGTHVGCDTAQCGACTVQLNGRAIKACSILAVQAEAAELLTIEGVAAPDGTLHPMQAAFKTHHGLQCGFCTPGMVLNAIDFARSNPDPSEQEVRAALEGNLCRCTGYQNIVKSIVAGARAMHAEIAALPGVEQRFALFSNPLPGHAAMDAASLANAPAGRLRCDRRSSA